MGGRGELLSLLSFVRCGWKRWVGGNVERRTSSRGSRRAEATGASQRPLTLSFLLLSSSASSSSSSSFFLPLPPSASMHRRSWRRRRLAAAAVEEEEVTASRRLGTSWGLWARSWEALLCLDWVGG